ncbi:MAG TPA: S41 family peptidase, partial [Terracidiphilus sp.]|nr:S41 family peptidase [Terracidiphilus sp.]
ARKHRLRYDCVYRLERPVPLKGRSTLVWVVCVSRFFQRFVFVLSFAIVVTLMLGFALGQFGWFGVHAGDDQDGAYQQMRVYAEVLQKIQTDYVTDPNMNDVTAGALHGLLGSLDADSSYLTPAEYKVYKDRPATGNAQEGMTISKRFGYATVVNVAPDSPADQNHLADGDVIEAINEKSTHDLSLAVIRMMLEGKPGSTVEVTVIRPTRPDPDKLTLTRALVPTPALEEQQYENSSILYIKPGALTAAHVDDIAAKIKAAPKTEKILLDLRDCTGEDAQQGLRLANFFIKQGTLATLQGQQYPEQTFSADPARFLTAAPLAVIVNRGTYGGAELAAAAIEELKRGDVVGERTFGEGSVQKTIDLPDGAALILTVAKYEGPDGKKIQDDAVTPTVAVASPQDDLDEGITPPNGDEMLNKALDLLKQKGA